MEKDPSPKVLFVNSARGLKLSDRERPVSKSPFVCRQCSGTETVRRRRTCLRKSSCLHYAGTEPIKKEYMSRESPSVRRRYSGTETVRMKYPSPTVILLVEAGARGLKPSEGDDFSPKALPFENGTQRLKLLYGERPVAESPSVCKQYAETETVRR